jgi:hypothetical protein
VSCENDKIEGSNVPINNIRLSIEFRFILFKYTEYKPGCKNDLAVYFEDIGKLNGII